MKKLIVILTVIMCQYIGHSQDMYNGKIVIHKDTMNLLNAIHMVETSGRKGAIKGDSGNALGPFQIWRGYYQDAVQKSNGKLNKSYSDVADFGYAKEVVLWYFYRYEPEALINGDFSALAKLHNVGPNWRNKPSVADKYWKKVQKHLK